MRTVEAGSRAPRSAVPGDAAGPGKRVGDGCVYRGRMGYYQKLGTLIGSITKPWKHIFFLSDDDDPLADSFSQERNRSAFDSDRHDGPGEADPGGTRIGGAPLRGLEEMKDLVIYHVRKDGDDHRSALAAAGRIVAKEGRLIVISYNPLWRPVHMLARFLRIGSFPDVSAWMGNKAVRNTLHETGFEPVRTYSRFLAPVNLPVISGLLDIAAALVPGRKFICPVRVSVARPKTAGTGACDRTVSVIVPCRNEKGTIERAVREVPSLGASTEILFCDDRSTDGTTEEILRVQRKYPDLRIRYVAGPGRGKAKNVFNGFDQATGDILMILDGDLTVPPGELSACCALLCDGAGDFINGTRMRNARIARTMGRVIAAGNRFFACLFSFLLEQPLTDTLCGTKVLWRRDWQRIKPYIGTWGSEDRWGDHELLLGAAVLHLKVVDRPVAYLDRSYGRSKMRNRTVTALGMLRMCLGAYRSVRGV